MIIAWKPIFKLAINIRIPTYKSTYNNLLSHHLIADCTFYNLMGHHLIANCTYLPQTFRLKIKIEIPRYFDRK